jgi:outer membrane receptor protein involved in Fe transport
MFYTVKGSFITDKYHSWAYDDPYDSRYLPSFYARTFTNTSYLVGGTNNDRFSRKTETFAGKVDLVAQLFGNHEVSRRGSAQPSPEGRIVHLQFSDPNNPSAEPSFTNAIANGNVFLSYIPTAAGGYAAYDRKPLQMAAYVQDKIELFKSIILNLGVRYEYFDPAAEYNGDLSQEISDSSTIFMKANLTDASVKHMVSPRLSVSYPITDQGTIRFSYGHFFQIGSPPACAGTPCTPGTNPRSAIRTCVPRVTPA